MDRLRVRQGFYLHMGAYAIVSALLSSIWALSGGGYFWPVWTMLPWGVGLAFHGLSVFIERTEPGKEAIEREMKRISGSVHGPHPTA